MQRREAQNEEDDKWLGSASTYFLASAMLRYNPPTQSSSGNANACRNLSEQHDLWKSVGLIEEAWRSTTFKVGSFPDAIKIRRSMACRSNQACIVLAMSWVLELP